MKSNSTIDRNSFLYNPKTYTIASFIVGYLLIGDLDALEQNALGNWLMTVAQILEANSAIQQAIEEKFQGNSYNINSKQYKNGGSPYMNNEPLLDYLSKDEQTIKQLQEMVDKLKEKLDNISS